MDDSRMVKKLYTVRAQVNMVDPLGRQNGRDGIMVTAVGALKW